MDAIGEKALYLCHIPVQAIPKRQVFLERKVVAGFWINLSRTRTRPLFPIKGPDFLIFLLKPALSFGLFRDLAHARLKVYP